MELLVVVMIMGVLATIAFASLRKYVTSAGGAEALNMVQAIRGAQERWRSEHMMYLNVSTPGESWYPQDPTQPANRGKVISFFRDAANTDGDNQLWLALRPTAQNAVRFGYMVNAGSPGTAMTAALRGPAVAWPNPTTDNWYVIQAIGDTDADGTTSYYLASSLGGEIFSLNHGE